VAPFVARLPPRLVPSFVAVERALDWYSGRSTGTWTR
jgi:hypothetical protein